MDGQMDGCMDGWTDRWMDRWKDVCTYFAPGFTGHWPFGAAAQKLKKNHPLFERYSNSL